MFLLKYLFNTIKIIFINLTILTIFGVASIYLLEFYYKLKNDYEFKEDVMFLGYQKEKPMMHTQDLYPFTNFHIQSNYTLEKKQLIDSWPDYYENMKYVSGDNGFFTTFNLREIQKKPNNEFRIILTGGSGAQGWGASKNEKMFYSLLEKNLQKKFSDRKIRLINLAMGGSITYENFIALNKWGHKIEPDLLISFSGNNDLNFPLMSGSDTSHYYYNLMGLLESTKTSNSNLKIFLSKYFPNINRSGIGFAINFINIKKNVNLAKNKYLRNNAMTEEDIVANYLHAIDSIRRDFPNIPFILAIQPSTGFIDKIKEGLTDKEISDNLSDIRYERNEKLIKLYDMTIKSLEIANHVDKDKFIDFNKYFLTNNYFTSKHLIDFCHLADKGHEVVAEEMSNIIEMVIIKNKL